MSVNAGKEPGKALFEILKNIISTNKNEKFALYGFSHRGNVIAECIEEIHRQKSDLLLNQVYFLDTPKTEWTEKAIHKKNSQGKYIAEKVYNIFPKKRAGLPWHLFDWTASFPCCANSFLFGRSELFDQFIQEDNSIDHTFFHKESNFLKLSDREVNRVNSLSNPQSEQKKTCSKNPFRWMLYYKKYIYLVCFIAAMQQYLKKRKKKHEFLIVMR